ncbi:MAG: 50S ribosomal protein L10 [bacterium]|nr:50S ribosomal protein L10 [bacterium]
MKVAESKKQVVAELNKLIKDYPIVGIVNVENLPAPQLQRMRAQLRDGLVLLMTKKRLMKIALDESKSVKKDIEQLSDKFTGMPALVFTKENPFKLASTLKKSKSSAPAKAGQTAPKDIIIPAGPTQFSPGPIISELSSIGLKTGVEGGKVAVKEESLVTKEGEKINGKVADVLTKLGVEPMEVGLDLIAIYEDGVIYGKDVLSVDEEEYLNNLKLAASEALNLSVEIAYISKDNIEMLLGKAFNSAKHIALENNIISDEVVKKMLGEADLQMRALKESAQIPDEAPKEEPKPEPPKEEPKPEPPKEEPAPKAPEPKKEEPKVEEKPKEEPKPEPPKEEKKEEPKPEAPKPEEKKEEPKKEAPKEEPKKDAAQEEKEIDEQIEQMKKEKDGAGKKADLSPDTIKNLTQKLEKKGTLRGE